MNLKSIIILSATISIVSAQVLDLKEGWNLVGLSNNISATDLSQKSESIDKVYFYRDASWQTDGNIESYDGVWIKSKNSSVINLDDSIRTDARIDTIKINKGWNLISLPMNTTISPKIFESFISVWKYKSGQWEFYSGIYDISLPEIDSIASGEGFWINSNIDTTINLADTQSELVKFDSNEEMIAYIDSMVKRSNNIIYPEYPLLEDGEMIAPIPEATPIPVAPTAPNDSNEPVTEPDSSKDSIVDNSTSTNLQEADVDEADILKHNGDDIFYLKNSENAIFITSFDKLLNSDSSYGKIGTTSNVNEMFLINDKLITISPNNLNFYSIWSNSGDSSWSSSSLVEIFDVSNIADIKKLKSFKIDGNIVDSRVTNGKLYLVTRYMPYVDIEYPKVYLDSNDCNNLIEPNIPVDSEVINNVEVDNADTIIREREDIIAVEPTLISEPVPYYDNNCYYYLKDENGYYKLDYSNPIYKETHYIPYIQDSISSQKEELINYKSLYAPIKVDQNAFITSISEFNLDEIELSSNVSFVGNSNTLYASNSAIYLVSQDYPLYYSWMDYKQRSAIYKFSIDEALSYNGREFVDGYTLNQFSLSEYNDVLRVATTTGFSWMNDTNNIITTLKEDNNTLSTLGVLENLGKEGETIKGVRFIKDRGFVVTFKQTDPLYTIDLSNPSEPKKVGELEISGYSSYFHPIDDNRILSVGQDADLDGRIKGVQLELFDISDFANPILADKVTIGDSSYYGSEAIYNHKSFTYRDSDSMFAIPINHYGNNYNDIDSEDGLEKVDSYISNYFYDNYLDIYRVNGLKIDSIKQIKSTIDNYSYNNRSIIFTKDEVDYAIYFTNGEFFIDRVY